jgi:ClpP class serine protease
MYGMISQRSSIWQEMFGGTSTQGFGAAYTRAVNDDRVKAIVFDVDSPGGTTAGVKELSDIKVHLNRCLDFRYVILIACTIEVVGS